MHKTLDELFASPESHQHLALELNPLRLYNMNESYVAAEGVFVFLQDVNSAYEGAYLNKVKYLPKVDRFPFTMPIWAMAHGYVWEVRKQFKPGSILCELGCASGVNYFGSRYEMVGVDYSFSSLKEIENYRFKIQADAIRLPFRNESLDGIVSSYFWEHISPSDKEMMLQEFYRVLKPGGKVVMLYDIETKNSLISRLKKRDIHAYNSLFLDKDYHIGYETLEENWRKFIRAGYTVIKHFGMERTFFQSGSVYAKLSTRRGGYGLFSRVMRTLSSMTPLNYFYMSFLRIVDETVGRFWSAQKSRIILSVIQKLQ